MLLKYIRAVIQIDRIIRGMFMESNEKKSSNLSEVV